MTSNNAQQLTQKLNQIKMRPSNKTCFDCGEKGTTYACINFGTFICSRCAGLLRELNYKVKGISVSIFTEKEVEQLDKIGNENAKKVWMAKFKGDEDRLPNPKDSDEVKRFLIDKYNDKKYYKKKKKKDDDEDEEEEENKKKKKKKNKNKKKESSSSEEESESSSSEEEEKKKKPNKKNNKKKDESSSSSESESEEEEKKKET